MYIEFHMASMDNVGWDCKEFFKIAFERRLDISFGGN